MAPILLADMLLNLLMMLYILCNLYLQENEVAIFLQRKVKDEENEKILFEIINAIKPIKYDWA